MARVPSQFTSSKRLGVPSAMVLSLAFGIVARLVLAAASFRGTHWPYELAFVLLFPALVTRVEGDIYGWLRRIGLYVASACMTFGGVLLGAMLAVWANDTVTRYFF